MMSMKLEKRSVAVKESKHKKEKRRDRDRERERVFNWLKIVNSFALTNQMSEIKREKKVKKICAHVTTTTKCGTQVTLS